MKKSILLLVALLVVAGAGAAYWRTVGRVTTTFRLAPVTRGDIRVSISATGTVEPEEVVDVGAQVAGRIETFGKDPSGNGKTIDYGSTVEEGTILAHINDSLYAADVASSTAQVDQAKANVQRARADLTSRIAAQAQSAAGVDLAQITLNHLKEMSTDSQSYLELQTAEATLKQAQATLDTAKANVGVGEAAVTQSEKAVAQAEADLTRSKTNLEYCTIRSPVKGSIIDRRVNIGQTVVASLSAPSLFLIAKDLRRMQVWVAVNEADIGSIHIGQPVTFTVDAYPGQTFQGEVNKVRLNATMTQNVVTYTVEVTTDNSSGRLLPYLTANVQFEVMQHKDVLVVPNTALRWSPRPEQIASDVKEIAARDPEPAADGEARSRSSHSTTQRAATSRPADAGSRHRASLWIVDGEYVRPIEVLAGPSDGRNTEVRGKQVVENMQVVIGEQQGGGSRDAGGAANPFVPQFRRGGTRGGGGGAGGGAGGGSQQSGR